MSKDVDLAKLSRLVSKAWAQDVLKQAGYPPPPPEHKPGCLEQLQSLIFSLFMLGVIIFLSVLLGVMISLILMLKFAQ